MGLFFVQQLALDQFGIKSFFLTTSLEWISKALVSSSSMYWFKACTLEFKSLTLPFVEHHFSGSILRLILNSAHRPFTVILIRFPFYEFHNGAPRQMVLFDIK